MSTALSGLQGAAYQLPKRILFMLALIVALPITATDIYLPSLTSIQTDLNTTENLVQITLSVYFIVLAITQLFYGPLCDRLGRKPILIFGIIVYTVSSLMCSFANSIEMLIVSRALQALGAGVGPAIGFTLIQDFSKQHSARLNGQIMALVSLSPIVAPMIGGFVETYLHWRSTFLLLMGMSILALVLMMLFLEETLDRSLHTAKQTVLKRYFYVLSNAQFRYYALATAILFACLFTFITVSPILFMERYGYTPRMFSILFGVAALGYISGARLCTAFVSKWGMEKTCYIGARLVLLGGLMMLISTYLWPAQGINVILSMLVVEIGISCAVASGMSLAAQKLAHNIGTAISLMSFLRIFISGLSSALIIFFENQTALPLASILCCLGLAGMFCLMQARR